ncbi:right-handed parallel beta-helix repeat-containing protein [Micromonospora zhanjiangensis]|uniref:Right-handed parallel beta-helix repeat-containing protein n=1 Tax=Micromonospora zhanjiangensis TaxID=1522057 RepID=A0ABV8KJP7_9ACTN
MPCDPDRLIAAISLANAGGAAILQLADNCTYSLSTVGVGAAANDGLPVITQPISIVGNNTSIVRAASAAAFRLFDVGVGGSLSLKGLTLNGGQVTATGTQGATGTEGGGAILVRAGGSLTVENTSVSRNAVLGAGAGGGAIANYGTAEIKTSNVTFNTSTGDGGGILNAGLLRLTDVNLTDDRSTAGNGGGLANAAGGNALLVRTTVSNDTAAGNGGGIFAAGGSITQVQDSEISEDTALGNGGGIFNLGAFTLLGSTVHRNDAITNGGGVYNNGQFVSEDSTVSDNTANQAGGGILNGAAGTLVLRRDEISRNSAGTTGGGIANLGGTISEIGTTVIDNSAVTGPGGIFSTTPLTVDAQSLAIRNRPSNCTAGVVPNCFG